MAISLDMRRDLPKVRENYANIIGNIGRCTYTSPCAVGVMMTADERKSLGDFCDGTQILNLIRGGLVSVPDDQQDDFDKLQSAFDIDLDDFNFVLAELEAKYAPLSDWTKRDAYLSDIESVSA